jgi:hypothetical protein
MVASRWPHRLARAGVRHVAINLKGQLITACLQLGLALVHGAPRVLLELLRYSGETVHLTLMFA